MNFRGTIHRLGSSGFAIALLVFSACSAGDPDSSNDGTENPRGKTELPQSPSEALARLSSSHRDALEAWKSRLTKSCNATEALTGRRPMSNGQDENSDLGLDAAALLERNGHSWILKGEEGEFALLGSARTFPGWSETKYESSVSFNSRSYSIQAETKRGGEKCELYVLGQKVHEFPILADVEVRGYSKPSLERKAWSSTITIQDTPSASQLEVTRNPLTDGLARALAPSDKAIGFLANRFGMEEALAKRLFRLSSLGFTHDSIRLTHAPSVLWMSSSAPSLIGDRAEVEKLFARESHSGTLEWRVLPSTVNFLGHKNDADQGSLRFFLTLEIGATLDQLPHGEQPIRLRPLSVRFDGLQPFQDTEATECLRARVLSLKGLRLAQQRGSNLPLNAHVEPSVNEALGGCTALISDIQEWAYQGGVFKSLLPEVLAGVEPSARTRYNDWDRVVSRLVLENLEGGKNPGRELDPAGTLPVIQKVSEVLGELHQKLQDKPLLRESKERVYRMGYSWAFSGKSVSAERVSRILTAAENVIRPFFRSTGRLLEDLSSQPEAQEAALTFAFELQEPYKLQAIDVLTLSRGLEYTDWERDFFDAILQRRPAIGELTEWKTRLGGIQERLSRYSNLEFARSRLAKLSVSWNQTGEASLDQIGEIYSSLSNAAQPFDASTRKLIEDLSQSLPEHRAELDFAARLDPGYKQSALTVRDRATASGMESWGKDFFSTVLQNRPALSQLQAWDASLQAIVGFNEREAARLKGDSNFFNESYRKDLVQKAWKEGWTSDDFTALEQIAELARHKMTCERHRGASSLSNCAGADLFSKQQGRLLDPSFNHRYINLALEFTGYMNTLPEMDFRTVRRSMVNAFFGSTYPIWSSCQSGAYTTKTETLRTQVDAISKAPNMSKRWEIERAIDTTLRDCI